MCVLFMVISVILLWYKLELCIMFFYDLKFRSVFGDIYRIEYLFVFMFI